MKQLFYSDLQIEEYEQKLEFSKAITYLEDKFRQNRSKELLLSIITFSWFYMVEGDVNQEPIEYNWEFFKTKLVNYLNLALKLYNNDERFCYIIGYILSINWEYLGQEYESLGKDYIKKCYEISSEEEIKFLVSSYMGKSFKVNEGFLTTLCDELFPSSSIVDTYFKGIIEKIKI